ncbi:hypothetical protein C8A01DRAFT_39050 [Parachaetomium inaequale]|uniref:Uncharacterized protein n=1 Tax=Parachaetomium inaequale TaxID=2588326 RepID=A0AAN6P9Y6_9PEZI|nr:hypothetical protein C8A01DRAFT_39050 [Parachaetomium inaequale]
MCVTYATADPQPATTNVGLGQCAGTARAGAEIYAHAPQHTLLPASLAAASSTGDDAASFDLLFCAGGGGGDYTAREDTQMVMQEFVADPEGRSVALRHLGDY